MTAPGKCDPGQHRLQNGQCVKCGLPWTSVKHEQDIAVARAVTRAAHAIIHFLTEHGEQHAAEIVADEFLTLAEDSGN